MGDVIDFKTKQIEAEFCDDKFERTLEKILRVYEARKVFKETGKCGYCGSSDITLTGYPCYYAHCNSCNHIAGDDPSINVRANMEKKEKEDEQIEILIILLGIFSGIIFFAIFN